MFITNLNKLQQEKLLALAEKIVSADGVTDQNEKKVLASIKEQCLPSIEPSDSTSGLASIFETQKEKISLLIELISISLADGDYHKEEIKIIKSIAEDLDVSLELLQKMESWIRSQLRLIEEVNILMEDK